jgi:hypothetical protein
MMKLYPTLFTFLLITSACKYEDIAPTNPCINYSEPSAEVFLDMAYDFNEYAIIPTKDTFTSKHFLRFRSPFAGKEYTHKWYIGAEVLTGSAVQRDFNLEKMPQNFTIYHAMRWKPNTLCNPKDDGYDSTVFNFRLTDRYMDMAIMGKYRIKFDTTKTFDSIDIQFYFSARNFGDSIVKNPINGPFGNYDEDEGIASSIDMRIKGLPYYYPQFGYLDSKINPNLRYVISDKYIYLHERSSGLMNGGEFSLDEHKTIISGYFRNGNYINGEYQKVFLTGRKIN